MSRWWAQGTTDFTHLMLTMGGIHATPYLL
jgi:hypothetical protein